MLIRDELTVCRWEGAWVGGNWVRLFIFHRYSSFAINITIILIAHYSFPPCTQGWKGSLALASPPFLSIGCLAIASMLRYPAKPLQIQSASQGSKLGGEKTPSL